MILERVKSAGIAHNSYFIGSDSVAASLYDSIFHRLLPLGDGVVLRKVGV